LQPEMLESPLNPLKTRIIA